MRESLLATRARAEGWQRSWDRLEADLVSDRELRIRALIDVVDAIAGSTPTVLDLACGPGTVTRRLLDRLPAARSIAVDVDPVLLTIASATFADDDRVRIVRADLRDPTWVESLPDRQVDAVLTSTALHWLPEDAVRRMYSDLGRVVRRGGVVAHAEEMPLVELPRLGAGLARVARERRTSRPVDGLASWDAWWEQVAADPALRTRWPSVGRCSQPAIRLRSSHLPPIGTLRRCRTQASLRSALCDDPLRARLSRGSVNH